MSTKDREKTGEVRVPVKRHLLPAFIALYIFSLSFNLVCVPLSPGLDESYFAALNFINQSEARFGLDIETTYGPLGYLSAPLNTQSHVLLSSALSFFLSTLSAIVLAALLLYTFKLRDRIPALIFWIATAFFCFPQSRDYQLMSTFMLCLISSFAFKSRRARNTLLVLSSLIAAFSVYVKFNNALVMSLDLFLAIAVIFRIDKGARKITIIALAAFLGLCGLLGTLFFNDFSAFSSFIFNSFDVASAYAMAMSTRGRSTLGLACAGTFLLVISLLFMRALWKRAPLAIPLLLSAVPLLMAFKHSFVREMNICKFPFVGFICLALSYFFISCKIERAAIYFSALILLLFVPARLTECSITKTSPLEIVTGISGLKELLNFLALDKYTQKADEITKRKIEEGKLPDAWLAQLEKAKNGVDCVPIEVFYCFANQLKWKPNPPIQLAYAITPKMDKWCASRYASKTAAEFLLVGFPDCDWRHPFFTAPESWRSIFRRYKASAIDEKHEQVLFEQREGLLEETLEKHSQLDFGPGDWVPVPRDEDYLVAKVRMKASRTGLFLKTFYRVDPIYVDVAYDDHKYGYFRFLPNTQESGFIVNPLPRTLAQVHDMWAEKAVPRTVFLSFHGDGLACYEKKMTIEFFRAKYKKPG